MTSSDIALTFTEVAEILRIVETAPRGGELSIELGDSTLHVRTAGATTAAPPAVASAVAPQTSPSAQVTTAAQPAAEDAEPAAATMSDPHGSAANPGDSGPGAGHTGLVAVSAPMTGMFYTAPAPGEPAFVGIGDRVEQGQDVAIIEVMKLMNRLSAPCGGVVREVALANEELVEINAAVMWIEPDEPTAA